jgi:hypothetical protein
MSCVLEGSGGTYFITYFTQTPRDRKIIRSRISEERKQLTLGIRIIFVNVYNINLTFSLLLRCSRSPCIFLWKCNCLEVSQYVNIGMQIRTGPWLLTLKAHSIQIQHTYSSSHTKIEELAL